MKALTICQPYAHLIVRGKKRVENRTWQTRYRGPLLIHAGKSLTWLLGAAPAPDMAFGALVGVANLVDCVNFDDLESRAVQERHPWLYDHEHTEGPWCWVLESVRRFSVPQPWSGFQGLWNVPDHLVPPSALL